MGGSSAEWVSFEKEQSTKKDIFFSLFSDEGDEYMAMCAPRYKPEELDKISNKTKFSKAELQVMYRGFKQVSLLYP